MTPLAQGQLVDAVVGVRELGVRPGHKFPLGIDIPSRRLHARDQLLRLRGSVVVTHIVYSEAHGLKPLAHWRRSPLQHSPTAPLCRGPCYSSSPSTTGPAACLMRSS